MLSGLGVEVPGKFEKVDIQDSAQEKAFGKGHLKPPQENKDPLSSQDHSFSNSNSDHSECSTNSEDEDSQCTQSYHSHSDDNSSHMSQDCE